LAAGSTGKDHENLDDHTAFTSMIPVILSGGSGTRLWPLSRERYPKQFLKLLGDRSLLQQTALRLEGLEGIGQPIVVCNEEHRFMVAEQLREIDTQAAGILLEPEGRNTAPAIALAALQATRDDPDALLLVLPADHIIADVEAYHRAVTAARNAAQDGALATFGIVPAGPETGYGYIRAGAAGGSGEWSQVQAFVEKPDAQTAAAYVAAGDYYWNSGMFLFKAARYLEELERHAPQMLAACREAMAGTAQDFDFIRPDREAFLRSPSNSVDYAVMEHTDRAVVVPLDAQWSDVGSWSALAALDEANGDGNVTHGDVLLHQSSNNYLRAEHRLLTAVGVEDLIVVETSDAVLVARRDRVQEVKRIVEQLKADERSECAEHLRVYRPWGSYERIALGDRFQAKLITVNPGCKISLQMHHHRAEHWVVVRGSARITRDGDEFLLSENESTYIPIGASHRLENPGKIPLELIEVQSGAYLGEDDIVRFDDDYHRS
jgi:mannose-1-phosphate guanylyltransferase/mannose-6-phosphate isomerase